MKPADSFNNLLEGVTIIIPLAEQGLTLRVMRCLGPLGARFILVSKQLENVARRSRYCERFIHFGGEQSDDAWVKCLTEIEVDRESAIVLPVTTAAFQLVARNRPALSARFHVPPLAEESMLKFASDKWQLYELASKSGLPVIRSVPMNASSVASIADGLEGFPFPLLIKPTGREHGRGFRKCDSAGALRSFYEQTLENGLEDFLIQPYLEGYDVSVSAFCSDGRILASATWEAQFYGNEGYTIPQGIRFEPGDESLRTASRLLALLNWEGVCDIDFFVDRRTGQTFLLEVNARFWANILACSAAGVNFPLLMCLASLGRAPQRWPTQVDGTFFCYPRGIPRLLSSRGNLWRFAKHPLRATGVDQILRDPIPEFYKAHRRLCRIFSRPSLDQTRTATAGKNAGAEWHHATGSSHIPR